MTQLRSRDHGWRGIDRARRKAEAPSPRAAWMALIAAAIKERPAGTGPEAKASAGPRPLRRPAPMRAPRRLTGNPDKPWTAGFLDFVLGLRPDQVLVNGGWLGGSTPASAREWAWIDYAQRLAWLYGPDAALKRLNEARP